MGGPNGGQALGSPQGNSYFKKKNYGVNDGVNPYPRTRTSSRKKIFPGVTHEPLHCRAMLSHPKKKKNILGSDVSPGVLCLGHGFQQQLTQKEGL